MPRDVSPSGALTDQVRADMTTLTCSVSECDLKVASGGLCSKHYTRLRRHGSTDDSVLKRKPNVGDCSVEGCDQPMRKRTWCAAHYAMWKRLGEVKPFGYKWAERGNCKVCGKPCTERGRREYCSGACQVLVSRCQEIPSQAVQCGRCGDDIELGTPVVGGGRKGRTDKATCDSCKRERAAGQNTSAADLAERDGTGCSICGEVVDMCLSYPDLRSGSVDHVIAYSRGGTHDPSNLALAHLVCNIRKRNHAA